MGRVIIISEPITFDRVNHNQSNYIHGYTNTATNVYPVQFYPTTTYDPNGQPHSLTASVTVPVGGPAFTVEYHDPFKAMSSFFTLHEGQNGNVRKCRKTPIVPMTIQSRSIYDVQQCFWDYTDITKAVELWVGDLMIQITEYAWNFCNTNPEDGGRLDQLLRTRRHSFSTPSLLREQINQWLDEQEAEYDFHFSNSISEKERDTVYVRSDSHAIHFKMRWYGEEPELEEDA